MAFLVASLSIVENILHIISTWPSRGVILVATCGCVRACARTCAFACVCVCVVCACGVCVCGVCVCVCVFVCLFVCLFVCFSAGPDPDASEPAEVPARAD